ncbi:hypothetical protein TU87_22935 [Pseudomonas weihenstephanensis]|nr:hypothetical protein TU87_22935 [Pseudomonas weihenstephanensis]
MLNKLNGVLLLLDDHRIMRLILIILSRKQKMARVHQEMARYFVACTTLIRATYGYLRGGNGKAIF